MQIAPRATAWTAVALSLDLCLPVVAENAVADERYGIAQRSDRDSGGRRPADHRPAHRPDRRHDHHGPDAATGLIGLFLGLVAGLNQQSDLAPPGCDPGAFQGWAQMRHPGFDYAFSYPSHWQEAAIGQPNILQTVVNPCPPHAAIIVARSEVTRLLSQEELATVMNAFQAEGGVFANMLSQDAVAMPGRMRRKGIFTGTADGVPMAALVHLVSSPVGLFIVVGIVPDAAGERVGTLLRNTVESFAPGAAFTPGG